MSIDIKPPAGELGTPTGLLGHDASNPGRVTPGQARTLLNVANGATANATDAALRDRATHTGSQLASTISDLDDAVAATPAVTANTAKAGNATHTGDVTGATALTIANGVVTNAKLATMATGRLKGRSTAGTGEVEDLTPAQVHTLLNISDGASANQSDIYLTDRANHTGTQAASTITNFATEVANTAAVTANTAKVTNATHTGDVTGSTALTIANDAVTNAKLANMANGTIKARISGGTGDPEDGTPTQIRALLNVADGATANQSNADLLSRANHTGTQPVSTITNFATEVANNSAVAANTAKVTNATHSGEVTGSGVLTITLGAVTNAKLAPMATARIKARVDGSTGDPQDATPEQIRTMLNVANGATANNTDSYLISRANHTGTQVASTISDFNAAAQAAVDTSALADRSNHTGTQFAATISDFATAVAATASVTANTAKVSNATHTGDVTGSTTLSIASGAVTEAKIANTAVTNAKLANMAEGRAKARLSSGAGAPEDVTAAQMRTWLNVEDGATAAGGDASDRVLKAGDTMTGDLIIQKSSARLNLRSDANNLTEMRRNSDGEFATIEHRRATGLAMLNVDIINDGTANALMRLFRNTNTSGTRALVFLRGDGTNTTAAQASINSTGTGLDWTGLQGFAGVRVANGTATGTLTMAAHSGGVFTTTGNCTCPNTAGFSITLIAGGAHTVNVGTGAAVSLATGDMISIVIPAAGTVRAVKTLAADVLTMAVS
jgi:hypothetical protein